MLGAFIQGFETAGLRFVGGSFDWLTPFSLFVGLALVGGYALLRATWLIVKTEGGLRVLGLHDGGSACLVAAYRHYGGEPVDAVARAIYRAALVLLVQPAALFTGTGADGVRHVRIATQSASAARARYSGSPTWASSLTYGLM